MHYILLISIGALFGSSAMMFKLLSAEFSVFFTVFVRFFVGGAMLSIVCLATKTPILPLKHIGKLMFIAIVNFIIPLLLFCTAGTMIDSSLVSILNGMFPVFTIIFAHYILQDKMSISGVVGVGLSMLGVCVLNLKNGIAFDSNQILAALMIILATICYATATIFTKMKCKDIPPFTNATAGIVISAILLLPSIFFETNIKALFDWKILLTIAYFGTCCTAIAYGILFHLIKVRGATFASNCSFLTPIFGTIYGIIFMHETMTINRIIGGLLILTGMALVLKLHTKFLKNEYK